MGNIQDFKLSFEKLKHFPFNWNETDKYLLKDGDVLFNRTNSAELVGKTAVYKAKYPKAIFASYLIRIELDQEKYDPNFLSYYMNSIFGKRYVTSVVSQQVGQANVNGSKLTAMPIPFLQLEEQHQIVSEIERRFSVADQVEKTVDNALKQAQRLRQSILKRAFEGKLVPQDPNDEPAEKLLERIKAEKAKLAETKKSRQKK
jgi:type I restriction enzyme S subunit